MTITARGEEREAPGVDQDLAAVARLSAAHAEMRRELEKDFEGTLKKVIGRVARGVETGVMSVNSNTSVRVSTPFGGFKQSGVGRELGPHALEHYSEVKTVYYATEPS